MHESLSRSCSPPPHACAPHVLTFSAGLLTSSRSLTFPASPRPHVPTSRPHVLTSSRPHVPTCFIHFSQQKALTSAVFLLDFWKHESKKASSLDKLSSLRFPNTGMKNKLRMSFSSTLALISLSDSLLPYPVLTGHFIPHLTPGPC